MPKLAVPQKDLVFRKARPEASTYQIGDSGSLSLQVRPDGGKRWIFRYRRPQGGHNNLSFGPYPDILSEEAHELATAARRDLRHGIDPQTEHDAKRAAARDAAKKPLRYRGRSLATKARQCVNGIVIPTRFGTIH